MIPAGGTNNIRPFLQTGGHKELILKKASQPLPGVCGTNSQVKTRSVLFGFAVLLLAAMFTFTGCPTDPDDDDGDSDPDSDTRATLTAGSPVDALATDTTANVTFTGATGITSLDAADFAVDNGASITSVSVNSGIATVVVNIGANTAAAAKTYTVSIASTSTLIKGNATVAITQAAAGTGPDPVGSGTANITVGFNYGEITITGDTESNAISKSGADSLTLSATGYTDVVWYVDANTTGISEGSVTLNAADYPVRRHSITFTGTANGRRYSSKPITFTVLN
jgi:hypothetical protein